LYKSDAALCSFPGYSKMSNRPQILYYAWSDRKPPAAFGELNRDGYSCILQEVDPKVMERFGAMPAGSSTAAFVIVDLGESSVEVAGIILRLCPHLKGRTMIVGNAPSGAPSEMVFAPKDKIAEMVRGCIG